ncbi:hypothetical protein FV242_16700 [Methylobacterium sp. WL64]|uniref:hypothetical protein n=1 Tax=Methylobacterium sp. WL64 TaxID=2603894 RepID=UPI0011C963BE|nr:hypothetical protein [Methylobacterium sp. WL64]TXN02008.1 hypothetical protein FV242_16700 [Methylobacterium sp. WL64]
MKITARQRWVMPIRDEDVSRQRASKHAFEARCPKTVERRQMGAEVRVDPVEDFHNVRSLRARRRRGLSERIIRSVHAHPQDANFR